jgi:hypothetical protein
LRIFAHLRPHFCNFFKSVRGEVYDRLKEIDAGGKLGSDSGRTTSWVTATAVGANVIANITLNYFSKYYDAKWLIELNAMV